MKKLKRNFEPVTSSPPIVRVTVPASVAYNFEQLTNVTQKILAQLGCAPCHSGRFILYEIEDRFVVNENLEVRPIFDDVRINEKVF
jgi:hypothetical protein